MKDPHPLLDSGANELELALLRAGDADRPSAKARQAALAALGLSGAVLGASSPVAAAAGSSALTTGTRLLAAKWWAIGALVTASGAAGLGYAALASTPATAPSTRTAPQRSQPPLAARPAVELPAPEVIAPPAPVNSQRERPPSQPRGSNSAGNPGIQQEIALIDRARGAVAARQPAAAMAALDEHQRRFPGGVLTQEATLLRIETLLARGDKASAARLGRQFLDRYPRSPMAARVKTLIDG